MAAMALTDGRTVFDLADPRGIERFLRNVREAQENGFDLVCGCCGVGLADESDMHDLGCVHYPEGGYL